jgi:hypothetical protein
LERVTIMSFIKHHLAGVFLLSVFVFGSFVSADVVYDSLSVAQSSSIMINEIGNTVTLSGSKRFVTSFSVKVSIGTVGQTNDYIVRFYLPSAPGDYPGKLLWQSPPKTNVVSTGGVQTLTFDVPYVRVPDTFIFSIEQAGDGGFLLCTGPAVGSSPAYCWTNLIQQTFSSNQLLVRIEAQNRTDAILLGTINHAGNYGIGSAYHYTINFEMIMGGYWDMFGPSFTGVTEWDEGDWLQIKAQDIPEAAAYLTNGTDETLRVMTESTLKGSTESATLVKSAGIAAGYPDLEGCLITDIDLKLNTIVIDHSTAGWTKYTWDVTWEIWGLQKSSDISRDRNVNLSDFSIFASAWDSWAGQPNWNPLCDLYLPEDNHIDVLDLQQFCLDWAYVPPAGLEEDFETGNFSSYDWQHSGNAFWGIVSNTVYQGNYAAKSGVITHSQQSTLQVEMEVGAGNITFFRKVSSESGFDYLRFYIDGVEQTKWSGEVAWSQVSFPVAAGTHLFKWSYTKDSSITSGSDCAWIDNIAME